MSTKVLFVVPYPESEAPSQRFRVELYESVLKSAGINYDIVSFLDKKTWDVIFQPGHFLKKALGITLGYLRRIGHLFQALRFDYVFIHREATPIGPPVFEWMLARLFKKKIIYDFDDAIWIPNVSNANRLAGMLKSHWKVKYICKWAYAVTAGNLYLFNYAVQFTKNAVLLPTCVDVETKHNRIKKHVPGKTVIGWTGSHSTLFYLNGIIPVIRKLQAKHEFTFLVIADKKPVIDLKDWEFVKWTEEKELEDLLKMDVGIMPLKKDAWSEGKCGFKLIQYLSCGIPAIADPIGVNNDIIQHGVNGYLCSNDEEWEQRLAELIKTPELRETLGQNGRNSIVKNYSIQSQQEKFLSLFKFQAY